MKIGILTFHWATNYGAILQTYALQTYLEKQGHVVEIINYKPRQYDDTLIRFLRCREFLNIGNYMEQKRREAALESFRKERLHLTMRFYRETDLSAFCQKYDAVITGSDQVMNPSFLFHGERMRGSSAYFIGFPYEGKRLAYAVSFGCTQYPEEGLKVASNFIPLFDKISVREHTGIEIIKKMGFATPVLVPDPTILLNEETYLSMTSFVPEKDYVYMFFIRNKNENIRLAREALTCMKCVVNNVDGDYSLKGWLSKIRYANFVVTDSFHCVVLALFFKVPFVVITKESGNVGMNDRLYTLLGRCGIPERIVEAKKMGDLSIIINSAINWNKVCAAFSQFREEGELFLKSLEI